MIPVKQENKKDCVRACIASILELKIEQVPDWIAMRDDEGRYPVWWLEMQSWLKLRGYFYLEINLKDFLWLPTPYETYAIFLGEHPSGTRHAVVGKIDETAFITVFDPLTGEEGKETAHCFKDQIIEAVAFLVPLDPHKFKLRRDLHVHV